MISDVRSFISYCVPPSPSGVYKEDDIDGLSTAELLDWLAGVQVSEP